MKYFTDDFIHFFQELENNNNKEWFHDNKKRYEASVKKPFESFVSALIEAVSKHEKLDILAKDCILRINRDMRFAKDKTPYNLHRTAFISNGGRKNKNLPGLFIRMSPELVGVMGGCFGPDKYQLYAIRAAIQNAPSEINQLRNEKTFKRNFGDIRGNTIKRVPKEFKESAAKEPLILNKQYYYMREDKSDLITSDMLLDKIMEYYFIMKPLNDYLTNAIKIL